MIGLFSEIQSMPRWHLLPAFTWLPAPKLNLCEFVPWCTRCATLCCIVPRCAPLCSALLPSGRSAGADGRSLPQRLEHVLLQIFLQWKWQSRQGQAREEAWHGAASGQREDAALKLSHLWGPRNRSHAPAKQLGCSGFTSCGRAPGGCHQGRPRLVACAACACLLLLQARELGPDVEGDGDDLRGHRETCMHGSVSESEDRRKKKEERWFGKAQQSPAGAT